MGATTTDADQLLEQIRQREYRLLIDGQLVLADDRGTRPVIDPSTGQTFTTVPEATQRDVARAVEAAERAGEGWRRAGVRGRRRVFEAIEQVIEEHRELLAMADAVDSGNPFRAMLTDVDISLQNVRDWPGLALALNGETIAASPGNLHYTTHHPYGVVGKIVAFNHPGMFAMTRILAPLIVGNTVILKPGVQTPLSALLFGELIREVVPPGVLSVLSGGAETGDAMVTHPRIKRLGFTGSVPTGMLIQRRAAEVGVKHVSLELGGKNAMVVFPDADLDRVVRSAREGMNLEVCQGQSCGSTSRVFVHDDLHDEFVDRYAASVEEVTVGPAYASGTTMGPLVSDQHRARVEAFVERGRQGGARLVTGGRAPQGLPADGYYLAPTVFTDVTAEMEIAREEIFGPVISVLRWRSYDEMLAQVNAVDYGLTASVWTDDLHLAHKTAERVEAGYVWINDSSKHYWGTPFGGWKNSGLGREESTSELTSYVEVKAVHTVLREPDGAMQDLRAR